MTALIIAFLAIILVIASVALMRRSEGDPLMSRIEEYAAREEVVSIEEIELSLSFADRILVPTMRRLSKFVVRFTPQSVLDNTTKKLEMAGSPRGMSAAEFWVATGAFAVLFSGLIFMMMARFGQPPEPSKRLLYTLVAFGLGFLLPQMLMRSKIDRRKQAIIKKFPDALDLMTICVDAGLTFDGAMSQVAAKWDDPLSREFARVVSELQLGKTRRQALRDLAARSWVDAAGEPRPLLTEDEAMNLCIKRGTLNDDEREVINNHIVATIKMLESLPFPKNLQNVPEYAGGHHEKMDGTGYPRGLRRNDMSVQARIMAVADIFEALTASDRPYKTGKKLSECLNIMGRMKSENHIDPDIFDIFIRERVYLDYAQEFLDPAQIDEIDEAAIPGYAG
jgi:Flp pilus assembly protein TadB